MGSGKAEERRFVSLKDVFHAFPNLPINIDIKVDDDNLIREVSKLIMEYKREDYTVWGNFSDKVCKKLYAVVSIQSVS